MSNKLKVAFLFGAGAEGECNFDIMNGYEYLKKSLFPETNTYQPSLKNFFNKREGYFPGGYKYEMRTLKSSNFLLCNFLREKCESDREFLDKNIKYIKAILTGTEKNSIAERYDDIKADFWESNSNEKDDKECTKEIKSEFKGILLGKKIKYEEIKKELLKELFTENSYGNIEYDLNIGVSGTLDSYFHTIINPQKYGTGKFSKIFNYYWACYFAILAPVIFFLKANSQNDIPTEWTKSDANGKDDLDYDYILHNIHKVTKKLYSNDMQFEKGDTYYTLIKNKLNNDDNVECAGVATTNYYRFCETICKENTVYLNGQLKYFELPEILEVRDASDGSEEKFSNEKLFFPFIFGQSLVKPIVDKNQIDEFQKFSDMLKNSNILVILGYNINEDDNHINAFLHDYAVSDKRLIVVGKKPEKDERLIDVDKQIEEDKRLISEKLKCEETHIEYCAVKYGDNEAVVNAIFNKIKED